MARHLAPFSWRQRMAEMVRRRSFGCVLPLGRHASTNGSKFVHCASDTIALSSFQKEQNARHHKQFKREQALTIGEVIRGSQQIEQRPFGTLATIKRIAADLRYALDRASYGNVVALAQESGLYLKQLLELFEAPDIKKSFDANNKWDVIEQ